MKRTLALSAAFCVLSRGQILEMAMSANGSELHFASGYGLRDEADRSGTSRIYHYQPEQPLVLARGERFGTVPSKPYLSDDGQTRGWFTYRACFGSCMFSIARSGLVLERNGKIFEQNGHEMRVSRNGRWFFDSGFVNLGPDPRLIDLDSGTVTLLPKVYPMHPTHAVADDGTIVTSPPGVFAGVLGGYPLSLRISPPNQPPVEIAFDDPVQSAAISVDGLRILVLTGKGALLEVDRATLTHRTLYEARESFVSFSPSARGDRVLVRDGRRLVLIDERGPQVLSAEEQVGGEVLLSGDGQTGYAM